SMAVRLHLTHTRLAVRLHGGRHWGRRGHSHRRFGHEVDVLSDDPRRGEWLHLLSVRLYLVSARLSREPGDLRGRQSAKIITSDLMQDGHGMRRFVWVIGIAICLWPFLSGGATRDEFLMRTTQDYVNLCSTSPDDPMYAAAMGFCHGYGVGAYHYYLAETAGP